VCTGETQEVRKRRKKKKKSKLEAGLGFGYFIYICCQKSYLLRYSMLTFHFFLKTSNNQIKYRISRTIPISTIDAAVPGVVKEDRYRKLGFRDTSRS